MPFIPCLFSLVTPHHYYLPFTVISLEIVLVLLPAAFVTVNLTV